MPKRWRIATLDRPRAAALEKAAGVPPVVAQLLVERGIDDPEVARGFLAPKLSGLRDPELLPGAELAAELLFESVTARHKIVVYGDYDADGMTATAILFRCLRLLGGEVSYYVPCRLEEGYGLNDAALVKLAAEGVKTIVTVDNGVASLAEAQRAEQLGLQLIITDHHQMAQRLPTAAAIVHPQLPGGDYPFEGLCGAAVAFKVAWALCKRAAGEQRVPERMRTFLLQAVGLAAIGTVADVVPLLDENRILVRHGLGALRQQPTPGIAALERVSGLDKNPALSGEDVAFAIAPRLNAAGRLGQATLGVELLTTDDPTRAAELARYLGELNETRQSLERSVTLAARKQAKQQFDPEHDPALVLAERGWHAGVIGIVAGKLVEQYGVPVIVVSQDKLGVAAGIGSGRGVPGFDLAAALVACSEHLESHGGHPAAAGLQVRDENLEAFRIDFCAHVAAARAGDGGELELSIDAETPLAALTHQTVQQIEQLAPFGHGNRRPTLCTHGVRLASPPKRIGGAGRHLSLELEQHGVKLRAVAFGGGDWEEPLRRAEGPLAIAFKPVLNTFRGISRVEMHLEDWRVETAE